MKNSSVTFSLKNINQLQEVAIQLLKFAKDEKIFLFFGDMGVGKTTFIKALCQALEVKDVVTSPTFSIVNEYDSPKGAIFHFDFYRIKNESEVFDIGFEEYLYSDNYCFIEWPEKIINLWPERYVHISLSLSEENGRKITAEIRAKNS